MASSKSSRNEFEAGPWRILITRSHILKSKCERGKPDGCQRDSKDICDVCKSVPLKTCISVEKFLFRLLGGGSDVSWGGKVKLQNYIRQRQQSLEGGNLS